MTHPLIPADATLHFGLPIGWGPAESKHTCILQERAYTDGWRACERGGVAEYGRGDQRHWTTGWLDCNERMKRDAQRA